MYCCLLLTTLLLAAEPATLAVWPGTAPGETGQIGPETIEPARAGENPPTTRITNVSHPTLTLFAPPAERRNGAAVIVCPGGGHRILAWDKEGTEVADWLNTLGVTALVLKYRVPARDPSERWRAAVQDAQRAVSLVRSQASQWQLDPARIGILGFSAGGETAALTALFNERKYEPVDAVDQISSRPDFAVLVYPAYLVANDRPALRDDVQVGPNSPPMFFAHASDDRVTPLSSVLLYTALKQAGVPAELHVYSTGGHGFGLRPSDKPCTQWPQQCAAWMRIQGIVPE